ncbi:hypothetical protein GmHk_19G055683 [Glycine max]|nr:hypothetical protein GmHk_19G055683 [Glycine max]
MLCIAMQVNSSQCEIPPTVIPKNVKERNEVQLSKIISNSSQPQLTNHRNPHPALVWRRKDPIHEVQPRAVPHPTTLLVRATFHNVLPQVGNLVNHSLHRNIKCILKSLKFGSRICVHQSRDQTNDLLPHDPNFLLRNLTKPLFYTNIPLPKIILRNEHRVLGIILRKMPCILGVRRTRMEEHWYTPSQH